MRIAEILFAIGVCGAVTATGAGLADIDRRIDRLPEFKSGHPEYCLLVLGPNAARRVWLIRDGDVLYVDRNGNGDLTEAGERVAFDKKESKPDQGVYSFQAGDIPDGPVTHKELLVTWSKLRAGDSPNTKEILRAQPNLRGVYVGLDMALPGKHGGATGGRVTHAAATGEYEGALQFAAEPADAPILHFGGPYQVMCWGEPEWRVGRSNEVYLAVGTPGLGQGTTVYVGYEGIVPAGLAPELKISFPIAGGGTLSQQDELTRRCCTFNLYGDVRVPDQAIAGKATVELSVESTPGTFIAPSRQEVTLVPAAPGPKLEPVSARLKSKLEYRQSNGSIDRIQFSPDGKRLIAGGYPNGVIQIWDLATGKPTQSFEAGEGGRTSEYFHITADWKTLYAPTARKAKSERFERGEKKLVRVTYDDAIQVWDLATGSPRAKLQQSPPRNTGSLDLSPDGAYLLASEDVPGEYESNRPRALSLWDTATGTSREVFRGGATVEGISQDGKLAAVSLPAEDESYTRALAIYSLPDWKERLSIASNRFTQFGPCIFDKAGRLLIGTVNVFENDEDWENAKHYLRFWDVASGKELHSRASDKTQESYFDPKLSPDGRTLAVTRYTWPRADEKTSLDLIDVGSHATKSVEISPASEVTVAFHPSGRWLAAATQMVAEDFGRQLEYDESPQPRIYLIDVARGEIVETLIAPQTYMMSLAFSPDGATLATSGKDAVLLWDFAKLPEKPANEAVKK